VRRCDEAGVLRDAMAESVKFELLHDFYNQQLTGSKVA
jgi:hypothetical protein